MPRKKEDEATRKLVAKRLNEAIARKNITAVELSRKTGISESDISNYRHARYLPKQGNVFLLALALNVNPSWLWGLSDIENSDSDAEYLWNLLSNQDRLQVLDYMRYLILRGVTDEKAP